MSKDFIKEHYKTDGENIANSAEVKRALDNNHLNELSNGNVYDPETGNEYNKNGDRLN